MQTKDNPFNFFFHLALGINETTELKSVHYCVDVCILLLLPKVILCLYKFELKTNKVQIVY